MSNLKTDKYRLYPTKQQEEKLTWTLDRTRELYNAALQERREMYKYTGKGTTYNAQANQLPEIKEIREEYKNIHSQVLQDTLRRVDKAMKAFFRRVKSGEVPGFPRFQGKNRYESFTYPQAGFAIEGRKLVLSKIGAVKIKLHRQIQGTIKTCTLKREGDHWYACLACEVESVKRTPYTDEIVGIDLGVSKLATLSTGDVIENPVRRIVGRKLSTTLVVGTDGMSHAYSAYPTSRKRKATIACGEGHVEESHQFLGWSMQDVYGERYTA